MSEKKLEYVEGHVDDGELGTFTDTAESTYRHRIRCSALDLKRLKRYPVPVLHSVYGEGRVRTADNFTITVVFGTEHRTFDYPECFGDALRFKSEGEQRAAEEFLKTHAKAIAARRFGKRLAYDPVEDTLEYIAATAIVEARIREEDGERRPLGYCHLFWGKKKRYLAELGIAWRTPAEMNPRVMFD